MWYPVNGQVIEFGWAGPGLDHIGCNQARPWFSGMYM